MQAASLAAGRARPACAPRGAPAPSSVVEGSSRWGAASCTAAAGWQAAPSPARPSRAPLRLAGRNLLVLLVLTVRCAYSSSARRAVQQRRQRRPPALVAAAAAPPGAGSEAGAGEERPFSWAPPPTVDINGVPIKPGQIGLVADPNDYVATNPVLRADRGGGPTPGTCRAAGVSLACLAGTPQAA